MNVATDGIDVCCNVASVEGRGDSHLPEVDATPSEGM